MKEAIKFLLKPLIEFLEDKDEGEKIYQYLYFTRSGVENEVESAILHGKHNITIVGKPGMGKTSLMHYMFIELKRKSNLYPIILDYRKITPKKPETLLTLFVKNARKYFEEINHPVNQLTEETTLENCENHSLIIQQHLSSLRIEDLIKRMVLFLDDLDYAEHDYMKILKDYFLPYAQTDKAFLILSVRPPMLNTIKKFDQLRQYYHIYPREIIIPEEDIEFILSNRLKSILKAEEVEESEKTFFSKTITIKNFLKAFKASTLDEIILEKLRKTSPDLTIQNFKLPFDGNFYSKIKNITFSNLRVIEEILPDIIDWEREHPENSINVNFYDPFITIAIKKTHILNDLITEKTRSKTDKHDGNSMLQIVLEYFRFEEVVNDYFYNEMSRYGISKGEADTAISMLVKTPNSMIVPEFVFMKESDESSCIFQRYEINLKGKNYIDNILGNPLYYSLENEFGKKYVKSKRSYYEERVKNHGRPSN